MKQPENISRYNAVLFGDDPKNQHILRQLLMHLLHDLENDEKAPERDTYGCVFLWEIPPEICGGLRRFECIEPMDYLWMCGLVEKGVFMGNYNYKIRLPDARPFLEDDVVIAFNYDPKIFGQDDYKACENWTKFRDEVREKLYAGGVEWGSDEYWKRYYEIYPPRQSPSPELKYPPLTRLPNVRSC